MQHTLANDAERRLRRLLGRTPTSREISELRHGEQALGWEHSGIARARTLVTEGKDVRTRRTELIEELRAQRKRMRRLLRKANRLVRTVPPLFSQLVAS